MEKIIWTNRVYKEKYDTESREEKNVIRAIRRRKTDWIGYILRRNCLLIHASKKTYKVVQI